MFRVYICVYIGVYICGFGETFLCAECIGIMVVGCLCLCVWSVGLDVL